MKKLLTTLFAAFIVVSAFAAVDLQTTAPNVRYNGACERVGTMRFIVSNDQDYQQVDSNHFIVVKIQLAGGATLCKNLFTAAGGDDRDPADAIWGELETDGTFWGDSTVWGIGKAGDDAIYIKICAAPRSGTTYPSPGAPAWFIVGNMIQVGAPTSNAGDPNAICVDLTRSSLQAGDYLTTAVSDYLVDVNVSGVTCSDATYDDVYGACRPEYQLGTAYQPSDPAIAFLKEIQGHNFAVKLTDCGKSELNTEDVYLCSCYVQTGQDEYECHDTVRVGTLDLHSGSCYYYLEEDSVGMLPQDTVIELSLVDANCNPIDNDPTHPTTFFAGIPFLTTDATSGLAISAGTGNLYDVDYSQDNNPSLSVGDACPDYYDTCSDDYTLYTSITYTVTHPSTTAAAGHPGGYIILPDINIGRLSNAGPADVYVKIAWYPYPCGTGGCVKVGPIRFLDCPPYQPTYFQNAIYFPYFPETGYWWSGLAITNVNYFYWDVLPNLQSFWTWLYSWGTMTQIPNIMGYNQDVNVTLYLIEEDGDVYLYDAGTLPKSGILTVLLSDPAFSPVLMSGYTDDAFGDEKFWVVAVGTATVANTPVTIDGFGMLGDGTQAQGFLPRIPVTDDAQLGAYWEYLNNKKKK